ncbi:glycosyl hydrolase family 18 protein [Psychromonas hadalis]|uniref:glycosyl hydrolase family 18 protein n=1 Tax=Psychromonas hadalis TaxID=211669 RepID=UPI0003B63191|nr:glycosyl hydrolase family 18 protein [Psychromonas hadalis]
MLSRLFILTLILFSLPSFASQHFREQESVFVYYKQWAIYGPNYHIRDIPFQQVTHLVYQSADIDAQHNVIVSDEYADINHSYPDNDPKKGAFQGSLGELYKAKQKYPHLQTIISIGGWGRSSNYSDIASNAQARNYFALSALKFIRQYHFDGIEIDWPAPIKGASRSDDPENLNLLLAELREVLDIGAMQDKKYYTLMITPSAKPSFQGHWNINRAQQYLDYFSLPTNYIHGYWEKNSNHLAPLMLSDKTQQKLVSQKMEVGSVETIFEFYKKQKVAPQKLILNISSFATGWNGVKNRNNGLYQKAKQVSWGSWDSANSGRTGVYTQSYLKGFMDTEGYQQFWDDSAKMHWLYNADKFDGHFITYEDADSIAYKIDYIKQHNYNGIALRQIHNDLKGSDSLLSKIYAQLYPLKALSYQLNNVYKTHKSKVLITLIFLLIVFTLVIYWRVKQHSEEQEDADDKAQYIKMRSQLQHIETPLQGIQSLSQQIDKKQLPLVAETAQKLENVNRQSEQLNQLVQQLLHETTLADSSSLPKPEALAPLTIFQNAIKIIFPELKEKSITISLDISQALKNVQVDQSYLQQLFILLLSYLAQRNPQNTILHIKTIQQGTLSGFEIKEQKHNNSETMHQKQTLLAIKRCANMLSSTISYQTTDHHGIFFIGLPSTNEKRQNYNALLLNVQENKQNEQKAEAKIANNTQRNEHNRLMSLQRFSLQAEKLTDIKQLIANAFELFVNDNKALNVTIFEGQSILHQHISESDDDMSEVLEISPSSLGQYRFELRTKEPLLEDDIAYFQSLVAQIQMMRKQISELAKEPQLLSELYEIASQKDHIKYIQADKGYSGIVCDNKETIYLSLRLKNIKLYFKDESLLQIHRSYLVNPRKVLRVVQLSKIKYEIALESDRLPIARTYVPMLKESFPHWFE